MLNANPRPNLSRSIPVMSEEPLTTFENPIEDTGTVPDLNRNVTIFASGTVTVDGALEPGKIVLSQDDIRKAIGVGEDQYIPPLSSAKVGLVVYTVQSIM